jgi:hypothetical protein
MLLGGAGGGDPRPHSTFTLQHTEPLNSPGHTRWLLLPASHCSAHSGAAMGPESWLCEACRKVRLGSWPGRQARRGEAVEPHRQAAERTHWRKRHGQAESGTAFPGRGGEGGGGGPGGARSSRHGQRLPRARFGLSSAATCTYV